MITFPNFLSTIGAVLRRQTGTTCAGVLTVIIAVHHTLVNGAPFARVALQSCASLCERIWFITTPAVEHDNKE